MVDIGFLPLGTEFSVQFMAPWKHGAHLVLLGEPDGQQRERPARVWAGGFFLAELSSWQRRFVRGATEGWCDPPDDEDVCIGEGDGFRVRLGHNDDEGPIVYVYVSSDGDHG